MTADRGTSSDSELTQILADLVQAAQADPRNPELLMDTASVLLRMERTDEAVRSLRAAAALHLAQLQPEQAMFVCGQIFRLRPVDSHAKRLVAQVRATGQLTEGVINDNLNQGRARLKRDRRVSAGHPVLVLPKRTASTSGGAAGDGGEDDETLETLDPEDLSAVVEEAGDGGVDPAAEELLARAEVPPEARKTVEAPVAALQPSLSARTTTTLDSGRATLVVEQGAEDADDLDPNEPLEPDDDEPTEPAGRLRVPIAKTWTASLTVPVDMVRRAPHRSYPAQHVVLAQTDPSNELLLVEHGRVEVSRGGVETEVLTKGSFLGELGVLGDGQAHVRYRTVDSCGVRVFGGALLRELLRDTKLAERVRDSYRARLQQVMLRTSGVFALLSEAEGKAVMDRAKPLRCQKGDVVMRRGEPQRGLYLVLLGRLIASAKDPNASGRRSIEDGDLFGWEGLLAGETAPATVVAASFCQLLYLERRVLLKLLQAYPRLGAALQRLERA